MATPPLSDSAADGADGLAFQALLAPRVSASPPPGGEPAVAVDADPGDDAAPEPDAASEDPEAAIGWLLQVLQGPLPAPAPAPAPASAAPAATPAGSPVMASASLPSGAAVANAPGDPVFAPDATVARAAPPAVTAATPAATQSEPLMSATPADAESRAMPDAEALLPAAQPASSLETSVAAVTTNAAAGAQGAATSAMPPPVPVIGHNPHTGAAHAPPPPEPLPPQPLSLTQHDWGGALGEHIAWMVDQDRQDAVIELHPAELGSLVVRVETRGNEAQVTIVAGSAAARDLLQQALPQLRDLLMGQGFNQARAQVERPNATGSARGDDPVSHEIGTGARRRIGRVLLVDAYA
ncbi:MAG TPA: flagellar hook-length control protein FliK [Solimonas sp.]